jgi:predicted transcriptional regulator
MLNRNRTLKSWLGSAPSSRVPDLGERERDVLEVLWAHGEASAQQVLESLSGESISLSTVQSTLERLHRKQLISREKTGRAYRYVPLISRSQLIGGMLRDLAEDVAGGDLAPMLSGFLDYVAAEAPELEPGVSRALGLTDDEDPERK